ncbi:MAG: GNAT family N-acetyltransferase [Inquilinus sp.]|nr:GNAT family N-acetyltransferase [Inquilinus sp.]
MEIDDFRIEPLTPDRWDDLVSVLGRGGIGGCWCMYWTLPSSREWGEGAKGGSKARNGSAFRQIVDRGPPPGLLAYDAGEPVGWCRVMQRSHLPGLAKSRYFKTGLSIDGVWSLACFVVRPTHRGRGLTTVLTKAAIAFARDHGALTLEAYPWETSEEKYPSVIFGGMASTFSRLGFKVVQRTAPHKPMMRLALRPQAG